MTKRRDLNEEERSALLRSLTEVGPSKPVGYLPLYTIEEFVRTTPEALAAAAAARGLATAQFTPADSCIKSGAFYVYHREARSPTSCEQMRRPPAPQGSRLSLTIL